MPIVPSSYKPPFIFRNGTLSTVYSGLFRQPIKINQKRERLTLSDDDFLDLDWSFSKEKTNKLIILLHGLGGNAQRHYMTGNAKLFNENNIDAVCVNFRGCSGEDNLKYRTYHSGETEDLNEIINHIISTNKYREIFIKGFSLGGNVVLKYLGERITIPNQIKACIAISVPCDLNGASLELHKFKNLPYHEMFRFQLKSSLKQKQKKYPELISYSDIKAIKTLKDFDDIYTSKAHGFKDALDYYEKCSSLQFLYNIKIPTLIINAKNDSFLSPECFPIKEAKGNANLFLEIPEYGGHVGFFSQDNIFYNEKRALDFILEYK
ncbi:alpha/beta fold hydrolase [Yeosuana sp. MJ-SS3]|uniref:Alpha/beta fold hydrolase n=1 Tax=Gilvirhabdus luticola TaxID=3079858 RepID=A0ABU3U787_9FLAO|nr:alpha/beta fold hydrolase [Yeosuana sp. MJ-SS3]MDU8886269.1 alpha/beta fold hydrolase [Yeosuana sp. MJ-SS3]